jgi:ABC-type cobalamin/Fe3+-siderophores transport system ATPase subunit
MKIIYAAFNSSNPTFLALKKNNCLLLIPNSWNDYDFITTFDAKLYFNGEVLDFNFHYKICINDEVNTNSKLKQLKRDGWNGVFPIPNVDYISTPSDIEFYSIIASKLGTFVAEEFFNTLRDASYLVHTKVDKQAILLTQSEVFKTSLMRESGANKAFQDGWSRLDNINQEVEINDFTLNFRVNEYTSLPINFKLKSNILPHDINVLIGPNGIGKSYCLRTLVEYWLKIGLGDPELLRSLNHEPFDSFPNFSKLILLSYSPFEEFSLNFDDEQLQDHLTYKYFGLRHLDENGEAILNKDLPVINATHSLIKSICNDDIFTFVGDRVHKIPTLETSLQSIFEKPFDSMVLEVLDKKTLGSNEWAVYEIDGVEHIPVNNLMNVGLDEGDIIEAINLTAGVKYIRNNQFLKLSSGQKLFSYMVMNIIGEIKKNSLIIVDEPELFLHPTLEIEFVDHLKVVLETFKSKAIIATHSLSIVREIPSKCVHIYRDEGNGLEIVPPPFQTFGADVQRISSYVFGDKSVTKPSDNWLDSLFERYDSNEILELLDKDLNEEMIMNIRRLGRKYGR